jgi:hypothetical protein
VVRLDDDGAGRGWFVDPTPGDDAEFGLRVGSSERVTTGGPASGRYDLLTVVLHELAHVLGRDDLDPAFAPHDLLTETLGLGVRRLPASPGGLDAVAPQASNPAAVTALVPSGSRTQALAAAPAPAIEGQVPALSGRELVAALRSARKRGNWVEATDAYLQTPGDA